MAIQAQVALITAQEWPQGDIRDPLGLWGARTLVTGDATGGSIRVQVLQLAAQRAAYVYTCYYAMITQLTGTEVDAFAFCRLLTNWPNVDPQAGVQAFATFAIRDFRTSGPFGVPVGGLTSPFITEIERFILLYDPRPTGGDMNIIEMELATNSLAATYSFEAYGYYWDRSVMQAPGGPRHPGSN